MNLKRIIEIYGIIKKRLPSTYKFPKLAFFEDEESMLANNKLKKLADEENVYAVVNPSTLTISLPLSMSLEYTNRWGNSARRTTLLQKMDEEELASVLLHELSHVYFGERYGYDSKQYSDEKACDAFAKRWVRVLKKEKLL